MALYRYFQASEKSSCKLPDPRGPPSRLVPSSSIVSANEKVQSALESKECTQSGWKGQRYSKLSPEQKAEVEVWEWDQTQHGCYSQVLPNCWGIGVVNLQLEVGGASRRGDPQKLNRE